MKLKLKKIINLFLLMMDYQKILNLLIIMGILFFIELFDNPNNKIDFNLKNFCGKNFKILIIIKF